jgi:RNA polymerase sigma-70 factor (ECF subfamily)
VSDPRGDEELLAAWRAGESGAGDELLRRHFAAVYRFFAANVAESGRGLDPEDLTQRTFEACITNQDRIHSDFRGYLFGIARRQLYLEWKRRSERGEVVSPSAAHVHDVHTSPSAAVARLDEQRLFLRALARVPPEFRTVLDRFYWAEQPIATIAAELGIAVGTVKSRLFRGKGMLRDALVRAGKGGDALVDSVMGRLDEKLAGIDEE